MRPLSHLGDATIALILLIAVVAGADLRWVVGIMLALEVFGCLCKALGAFCEPIADALKGRGVVTK